MNEKLRLFTLLLQTQQMERLKAEGLDCEANIQQRQVSVKNGKKFTKVDVGTSGKFMIENETGNIFGIKAYGVVHRGHWYGTLDTLDQYDWSGFYPVKISNPTPLQKYTIPALTFAPSAPE